MQQWEQRKTPSSRAQTASKLPPRAARPASQPSLLADDEAVQLLRDGAGVQRKPMDAGYRDLVQAAEAGTAPAASTTPKVGCTHGCAQRWGQNTTCSKFGFQAGEFEHAPQYVTNGRNIEHPKSVMDLLTPCCNTWPFAVEEHARKYLGLNGAASCPATHQREIATVGYKGKEVQVLCSDATVPASTGPTNDAKSCTDETWDNNKAEGKQNFEMVELSPQAIQDLSGSVNKRLHVSICFSGTKQDMCNHDAQASRQFLARQGKNPEAEDCLTGGCTPDPNAPKLKKTGWPR